MVEIGSPLVTVVCLCYNQASFVLEALNSVVEQTYPNIELIIVDDASTDNSVEKIEYWLTKQKRSFHLIVNEENKGGNRSFNSALKIARGRYIIDLAADDYLISTRISKQVEFFERLPDDYALIFSDAWLQHKGMRRGFYERDQLGVLLTNVPEGTVYKDVIKQCFICTPTILFKTEILKSVGGYDETLNYEDFDIWVRLSRYWKFGFQNEILTVKRLVKGSHSMSFYKKGKNKQIESTIKVLEKAIQLNQTAAENIALGVCIRYHMRLCWIFGLKDHFGSLQQMLKDLGLYSGIDFLYKISFSLGGITQPLYMYLVNRRVFF